MSLIALLVYVAVFTIIAIVIWWVLSQLPLPAPLKQILIIVLVVIGAILLIYLLLSITGMGGSGLRIGRIGDLMLPAAAAFGWA